MRRAVLSDVWGVDESAEPLQWNSAGHLWKFLFEPETQRNQQYRKTESSTFIWLVVLFVCFFCLVKIKVTDKFFFYTAWLEKVAPQCNRKMRIMTSTILDVNLGVAGKVAPKCRGKKHGDACVP